MGQATPLRPAVNVTCRVVNNGNSTWTYDFTVWNYTASIHPYAAVYVSKFGLVTADGPSQESPSEWSDGAAWRHNDPTGGGLWYGQLVAGEQDPDDLTVPTVWSASWDGRLLEGRALNGFRITLPTRETEFVWQAYANGYEAVYPGALPGASRKLKYGAWFGALWPESVGVSEAYWEYAWNGTVEPEE